MHTCVYVCVCVDKYINLWFNVQERKKSSDAKYKANALSQSNKHVICYYSSSGRLVEPHLSLGLGWVLTPHSIRRQGSLTTTSLMKRRQKLFYPLTQRDDKVVLPDVIDKPSLSPWC